MASGAPIGPLEQPQQTEDWSTSMLRLQLATRLGIAPLQSVCFMDATKQDKQEFLSNNHHVTCDSLFVVVNGPSS